MKVALRELSHTYRGSAGGKPALALGELSVQSQSKLCLIGSSGSGKTTLLNILAGVLVPTQGRVELGDVDLFALSEQARDQFRARHVGCVFQTLNLLQSLSVLENLTLAQRFAGIAAAQAKRRGLELLEQLGLERRANARPRELSLGEQQRVAIIRAVCKAPGLVLADEPTASLDDENARAAIELLIGACKNSTLIVVSHDARLIGSFPEVRPLSELARVPLLGSHAS
ncbi:MAG TPA: ATP-binding cassette domain-containing protein [Polyangiaceae bacterium]|nr:ATP-binding cassette domain-containing protein [Polyangiaceae bacterium]